MTRFLPPLLALLALSPLLSAQLRLPALFGKGAVLQRDQVIPVWGWAEAGSQVQVLLGKEQLSCKADALGRWFVRFPARKSGKDLVLVVESGRERLARSNIQIGEVWICSGQSNMEWPLTRAMNATAEIAAAKDPGLRFFRLQRRSSLAPELDCNTKWSHCTPETAARFSGVGYFFGRELRKALGKQVPIGLIQSSWGGTTAQTWISPNGLQMEDSCKPEIERWMQRISKDPSGQLAKDKNRPGNLYRGMIHPLIPYSMRGVIWYQGENNASRAWEYRKVFPALIRDWRRVWALGPFQLAPRELRPFPFLFVQLANYKLRRGNPLSWAELREAQALALSLPATGMASAIDIGNPKDIHPKNKQEVGRRLALIARARVYGESKLPHIGPRFAKASFAKGRVTVQLQHVVEALRTRDGQAPSSFQVAGKDRKWYPAEAKLQGKSILLTSKQVPEPIAVRYGWDDSPHCNVSDASGLPLTPFRSDDWPGVTWPK
ncbi:MAG: sialate O-acetylesterase [Planctomycetota bacterium]|nr:MAG: sialate O-acetylesterase [Planctomycetota bacterium]